MLDSLIKYAQGQKLVTEPGFAPKTVKWCLSFTSGGQFVGLIELGDTSLKKNPGQPFAKCPDLPPNVVAGGVGGRSHFLIETAQVVALLFKDTEDEENSGPRTLGKRAFFTHLLRESASVMPELEAIANALDDDQVTKDIRNMLEGNKAKPGDKVTIAIDNAYPVTCDTWHPWWREFRLTLQDDKPNKNAMRCFVTGGSVKPLESHPTISGLSSVGGNPIGDRLICFDKDAFTSFGLDASANCAVSEDAASTYRAALNDLITKSDKPIAGAKVVHWFSNYVAPEDDAMAWLSPSSQTQTELVAAKKAKELLNSIRTGSRPDLAGNFYYAMTLSGASGRIMVRDWMEGRFEDLVENVGQWFDDLQIVNLSGAKPAKDPGIERVITSLLMPKGAEQKYADWVKPIQPHARALWQSALNKSLTIPYSVLAKAILLNTRFIQSGKLADALDYSSKDRNHLNNISLLHTRMALVKSYHVRKYRGGSELATYLNEEHPHPAYHCGRLMAMFAGLQKSALGDVGAGVLERFYASASTTPALVLGRLVRTSQFHLSKLEPGFAYWHSSRIAEVWARLQDNVPKTLSLEEQSLFALGFYQQIAADRAGSGKNKTEESINATTEETNE